MFVVLPLSLSFVVGNIASDLWARVEERFSDRALKRYFAVFARLVAAEDDREIDLLVSEHSDAWFELSERDRNRVRAWQKQIPGPDLINVVMKLKRRSERSDTNDQT